MPSDPGVVHGDDRTVVAWPTLFRERVERRARRHGRFQWWVLWTALGGLFATNVNFTIFAVTLPRLARELDSSINVVTWTITAPLLAFGVVAPALGRAGDVFGHRRLFLFGLCGELLATVACAVAPNVGALIGARVLGAVLGAAVGSGGMAMILREFDADERVKALGFWSLIGAGGPVLGVALGGPLIEAMGWRVMFWAQLPAIVLAILISGAILPSHPEVEAADRTRRTLDLPGAATIALAALALLFALNRAPVVGFSHPYVIVALVLVPIATYAFLRAERRSPDPLLPLNFLRLRNFSAPVVAQIFGNFTHMGGFILLPAMLNRVFGYGEARIGLLTISRPMAFAVAAPLAGYLAIRIGERTVAAGGCAAIVTSMLLLSTIQRGAPDLLIILALAIGGAGLGGASPALAATVANAMGDARLGVASAAQQLTQNIGVVSGIQIMTTVQLVREDSAGLVGSYSVAFLVGATAAAMAGMASLMLRSQPRDLPSPGI
ncbi:MAG TPA: MFS transporter [Acidimicrobiales bacterium]|nr:MFS transporter [Acidimicrobiales bacterium]